MHDTHMHDTHTHTCMTHTHQCMIHTHSCMTHTHSRFRPEEESTRGLSQDIVRHHFSKLPGNAPYKLQNWISSLHITDTASIYHDDNN